MAEVVTAYVAPTRVKAPRGARTVESEYELLAELARSGLRATRAFVVTDRAFAEFVESNRIVQKTRRLLSGASSLSPGALRRRREIARVVAEAHPIPANVTAEIGNCYAKLGDDGRGTGAVVKLSRVPPAPRFPGLGPMRTQEVNIRTAGQLLRGVRRSWASSFASLALDRGSALGSSLEAPELELVVQRQLFSEKSGVCLPVDGDSGGKAVLLKAVWGDVEALTDGAVVPDTLVVDRDTGLVVKKSIAYKARMKLLPPSGRELIGCRVPSRLRRVSCLSAGEAFEIASLASELQRRGIEDLAFDWAIEDGKACVTRARLGYMRTASDSPMRGFHSS